MSQYCLGIIGGSGLYDLEGLQDVQEKEIPTPFGNPSGVFFEGRIKDTRFIFFPRHGVGHKYGPSEINYRAHIYGLKKLGVNGIVSFSAVGSLNEKVKPGDFVLVDQFIDRTYLRASTFFSQGCVAHVSFADPTCSSLRNVLQSALKLVDVTCHNPGTYVCMEGPAFSTRAESMLYRSWNADVIGMTNLPEAKLAREAELCYVTVGLVTDYDCWRSETSDVDVPEILKVMKQNVSQAQKVIFNLPSLISNKAACSCSKALEYSLITQPDLVPPSTRSALSLFVDKYWGDVS
ncbi:MAG: S-methyl-5'-thioadenosine phosphorylase [Deltaproteobacteria bacterium]|nr:S-methyl-5'-thioadenosine phosphorylase [Deltaproteobacteria bacterium]